ncbi:diphosphomevalonate decarboxylase [Dimargaris verticillata]|uniref:Diphosphomevalonate decarboxylase n=1 Tax=Dimargaris verticillata TaxID=2761393 RepID=A0A9W8B532_9FUNG|nr:diphosphomevalonate decarboxylase [Dimargaris verticillata]
MVRQVTCTAPVNIAVIKYWGKRDTSLILPTNSSLSVTLSQDDLHSRTTVGIAPEWSNESDRMWLNGTESAIATNARLVNCLKMSRAQRKALEDADSGLPRWSQWGIRIVSENNFPTAAGLASSASGYACLVYTLAQVFELPLTGADLSRNARLGSGSACRSIFGGFVGWDMGQSPTGDDSQAYQVAPETHWPDLEALILVVSDLKKGVSSTAGMQTTVETSSLAQHRFQAIVPKRMRQMEQAILAKDFDTFAEITMRDSNQFHATCLDTFPPIFYLNDTSRLIIQVVTAINCLSGRTQAAYTFDAGPNAVIYAPKAHMPYLIQLFAYFFPGSAGSGYFSDSYQCLPEGTVLGKSFPEPFQVIQQTFPVLPVDSVRRIIHTRVGPGPMMRLEPEASLLNADGLPKTKSA